MQPKTLVLFDFDGTITSKDSMFDFLKYASGNSKFYLKMLQSVPDFALMLFKINSNSITKQRLLRRFLSSKPADFWQEKAQQYSKNQLNSIIKDSAFTALKKHLENNHRVIIVSASAKLWLYDWCSAQGVELLATELETKNGFFTGKIRGKNCNQYEKVNRINSHIDIEDFIDVIAYGDSKGDSAMLSLATEAHYKKFK